MLYEYHKSIASFTSYIIAVKNANTLTGFSLESRSSPPTELCEY